MSEGVNEARYEPEQERKWAWLRQELAAGFAADDSSFVALDTEELICQAKKRKASE